MAGNGPAASTYCTAKGGSFAGDNAGTPALPDDPDDRRAAFVAEVTSYISEEYPEDMIREFCRHWTEPARDGSGRMRFDDQPYWDTRKRLDTWKKCERFCGPRQTSSHRGKPTPASGPIDENKADSGPMAGIIHATQTRTPAGPDTPTPNNENGDNRPRRLYVGIDPGKQTGVAVWDVELRRLTHIAAMGITQAKETILNLSRTHTVAIWMEDARMYRKTPAAPARQLGAGSVRRDCGIWEEFCDFYNIPCHLLRPAGVKLSAAEFRQQTGWRGRTNEHGRDAAMLVFNRR